MSNKKEIIANIVAKRHNKVEGDGLFSSLKEGFSTLAKGQKDFNNTTKKTLSKYGTHRIDRLIIQRCPIRKVLRKALNAMSFGWFEKKIKKLGFDKLFHLQLVASITTKEGDTKLITIEKNAQVDITEGGKFPPECNVMKIPLGNTYINLHDLVYRTLNVMGKKKYFDYDAYTNNCQVFIRETLRNANLLNNTRDEFIFQNLDNLYEDMKRDRPYLSGLTKGITQMGSVMQYLTGGCANCEDECGCEGGKRGRSNAITDEDEFGGVGESKGGDSDDEGEEDAPEDPPSGESKQEPEEPPSEKADDKKRKREDEPFERIRYVKNNDPQFEEDVAKVMFPQVMEHIVSLTKKHITTDPNEMQKYVSFFRKNIFPTVLHDAEYIFYDDGQPNDVTEKKLLKMLNSKYYTPLLYLVLKGHFNKKSHRLRFKNIDPTIGYKINDVDPDEDEDAPGGASAGSGMSRVDKLDMMLNELKGNGFGQSKSKVAPDYDYEEDWKEYQELKKRMKKMEKEQGIKLPTIKEVEGEGRRIKKQFTQEGVSKEVKGAVDKPKDPHFWLWEKETENPLYSEWSNDWEVWKKDLKDHDLSRGVRKFSQETRDFANKQAEMWGSGQALRRQRDIWNEYAQYLNTLTPEERGAVTSYDFAEWYYQNIWKPTIDFYEVYHLGFPKGSQPQRRAASGAGEDEDDSDIPDTFEVVNPLHDAPGGAAAGSGKGEFFNPDTLFNTIIKKKFTKDGTKREVKKEGYKLPVGSRTDKDMVDLYTHGVDAPIFTDEDRAFANKQKEMWGKGMGDADARKIVTRALVDYAKSKVGDSISKTDFHNLTIDLARSINLKHYIDIVKSYADRVGAAHLSQIPNHLFNLFDDDVDIVNTILDYHVPPTARSAVARGSGKRNIILSIVEKRKK